MEIYFIFTYQTSQLSLQHKDNIVGAEDNVVFSNIVGEVEIRNVRLQKQLVASEAI